MKIDARKMFFRITLNCIGSNFVSAKKFNTLFLLYLHIISTDGSAN